MLLIVSDLHLADTPDRRTIDAAALCDEIAACAARAAAIPKASLQVLFLGDVFEILKSDVWLQRDLRPWDASLAVDHSRHEAAVDEIFQRIESCNADFFDRWQDLRSRWPGLHGIYIPGNHDWPINHAMGLSARRRLVQALGLAHDPATLFDVSFLDEDYGVLATHGHEHDPFNRTEIGKIAFGDAVVIEVLLVLPALVAHQLPGVTANDPRLTFLHELDNVRPQSGAAMAAWLNEGATTLDRQIPGGRAAVLHAVSQVVANMRSLRRQRHTTQAWGRGDRWISALSAAAGVASRWGGVLDWVGRRDAGAENDSYLSSAESLLGSTRVFDSGPGIRFYVCGHTHLPEHLAIRQRAGPGAASPMFLNTGTWRRVQRYVAIPKASPQFVTYDEECSVVFHNRLERAAGAPSYEFRRVARRRD